MSKVTSEAMSNRRCIRCHEDMAWVVMVHTRTGSRPRITPASATAPGHPFAPMRHGRHFGSVEP
jgi:hypothetical protein